MSEKDSKSREKTPSSSDVAEKQRDEYAKEGSDLQPSGDEEEEDDGRIEYDENGMDDNEGNNKKQRSSVELYGQSQESRGRYEDETNEEEEEEGEGYQGEHETEGAEEEEEDDGYVRGPDGEQNGEYVETAEDEANDDLLNEEQQADIDYHEQTESERQFVEEKKWREDVDEEDDEDYVPIDGEGNWGELPPQTATTTSRLSFAEESLEKWIPVPPPPPGRNSAGSNFLGMAPELNSTNALNLVWSFGFNRNIPVINLTDAHRHLVMYVCAHTGILYNFKAKKQIILQGHANCISCTCVSKDKHWLATADKGPDSLIIVWDTYSAMPIRTIFEPHPDGGVAAITMTQDAKYLASLSASLDQIFAIWDWTNEGDSPVCTVQLKSSFGPQTYIHFNLEDCSQIVSNSETQVIFYLWKDKTVEYFAPALSDLDFNKPVGKYSQTIFQRNSTRALSATSLGNLVTWDINQPITQTSTKAIVAKKKALKLVKLQDRGITVLTVNDQLIVIGDTAGQVKFFSQSLKLMNWYQDFNLGPVSSVSFAYISPFSPKKTDHYPIESSLAANKFIVEDFTIATTNNIVAYVVTDGTDVTIIHREYNAPVHALASHPHLPRIAIGGYSGLLKIWDYDEKTVIASRYFDRGEMIRCCAFTPSGDYLAIGFTNGSVRIVDSISLIDQLSDPFHYARDAITHVSFSHDQQYLATADAEFTVTLFRRKDDSSTFDHYGYVGRNRPHYKWIQEILFGIKLDSPAPYLLSLGEDRILVEYDLENSSAGNLVILRSTRIEQSAIPCCVALHPPVTKETFLLTANDQFKFKLYNSTTLMCRKTALASTYGSPIQKIVILPSNKSSMYKDKHYLAYITNDKIGLQILPLDGNQHKSMALIAHPDGVANVVTTSNGKYLFTAGGKDTTVHMWTINLDALEAQAKLGGEDLIPFYGMLEGNREGELFRELEDYFYYAQIKSQGVNSMDMKNVSTTIAIGEIPSVMRALGFYPSEQEIEDMLNEVKYSDYVNTGKYITDVNLGDLIKLYINHRPAFGLQLDRLKWAFQTFGVDTENLGRALGREKLLQLLQERGEHLTEHELATYLATLLGYSEEGGSGEMQEYEGGIIEERLPLDINAEIFANDILGFGIELETPTDPPITGLSPAADDRMMTSPSYRATATPS